MHTARRLQLWAPWRIVPTARCSHRWGAQAFLKLKFWDTSTNPQIRQADVGYYALAYSPDGSILATSGHGVGIQLWDGETGKKGKAIDTKKPAPTMFAFSTDGKILASICAKPLTTAKQYLEITLSDPIAGQETGTISLKMNPLSLAFSPDGKTLAIGGHEYFLNKVELWDLATSKSTTLFKDPIGKTGGGITSLAYTPDGKTLVTASTTQTALVDATTGKTKAVLEAVGSNLFALSRDGATLATVGNAGIVRIWSLAGKKQ